MSDVFGKSIGRYILLEQIGEGGMAKVFNAYDPRMELNVAIKVILPNHQSNQFFLDRFLMEAKSLAQLSHTNIVKILNYGQENNQPYIVMDYVGGGTLKENLGTPIPWQKAAALLAPIARALEYVHKQNIVHRDVKPSNILLDNNNQPMLSDFGVVKFLEEEAVEVAATGVGIGTPDYMSPEQGMGKEADFRADIYALGIVYFEMVTGQKPFSADAPMAVVIKHVTEQFPCPSKINHQLPADVDKAILKAVQKDPANRFHNMGEFAEVLEQLALGEKADKKRIQLLTRKKIFPHKSIRIILSVAILAVISLGILLNLKFVSNLPQFKTVANFIAPKIDFLGGTRSEVRKTVGTPTEVYGSAVTPSFTSTSEPPKELPTNIPTVKVQTENLTPTGASNIELGTKYSQGSVSLIEDPLVVTGMKSQSEIARWGIGGVNSISWRPDGASVLLGTTNGGFVYTPDTLQRQIFLDTKNWMEIAIYSLDGKVIYTGTRSGKVIAYNADDASQLNEYPYAKPDSERLKNDINLKVDALAISNSGRDLAVGYDNGAINVWSLESNLITMKIDQPKSATGLTFSADGRYLFGCNGNTIVSVWDIARGKLENKLVHSTPVSNIVMSADGAYFLTSGASQTVYLWSAVTEELLHSYLTLGAPVESIAISPDDQLYAFGLANGTVKVYQAPHESAYSNAQREMYIIKGHPDAVTSLAFSPDSSQLASTSWQEGLKIWDMQTGKEAKSLNQSASQIVRMQFSQDGKWLASFNVNNQVQVWDVYRASPLFKLDGYLPEGDVFSPHNDLLIVAVDGQHTWDLGELLIVDVASEKVIQTLPGFKKGLQVSFIADQSLLVIGDSREATIWDTSIWEKVYTHGGSTDRCGQYFTPDNQRLAIISEVGIYQQVDSRIEAICGSKPKSASLDYFFYDLNTAIFTVTDGIIFEANPKSVNLGWLATDTSIRDHKDTFLSALPSRKIYAFSRDNNQLIIKSIGSRSSNSLLLPYQNEYRYTVAFSSQYGIVALGTKFGSIHFYVVQP